MPEPGSTTSESASDRLLCRAAAAAAGRRGFLAAVLARFRAAEGLDDAALAAWLGVAPVQVCRLGLCRRPRSAQFRADVGAIAGRFGVDPARLAALIRQVDALTALDEAPPAAEGLLAAARDRDDGPPDEPNGDAT